jgi:hypothetical protein
MAVSKRTGKKSLAANDFLIPSPPGPPTANDVGTNRPFDNGSAVVEFSPVDLAVSYKIYAASAGQTTVTSTGTSSPIIVTGLKSNTSYTFTAAGINDQGIEGEPSESSTPTLITTVPATPAAPTASSPNANQDVVSWLAPATGGKTITGYIWAASDGKTNLTGGNPGGGSTLSTSVTVNQEAATAQTYTVYAINANGNSLVSPASNSITTTFSFAPFGAFGFSPFGFSPFGFSPFGFSPFMAFGFSPFGFSPFMAFGFSPFGFAPFMAFGFSPFGFSPFMCIAAKTKIPTVNDNGDVVFVAAEDIKIGDKVICPIWSEFQSEDSELLSFDSELMLLEGPKLSYEQITNLTTIIVPVKYLLSKVIKDTVVYNFDSNKHFSTVQPLLTKKQNSDVFSWILSGDIVPGDIVMEYNSSKEEYEEVVIKDVRRINDVEETVYRITPERFLPFIAGDIVAC